MANIKVNLDYEIIDGADITFKAPCDCSEASGLIIYYPQISDGKMTTVSKEFTFRDAHGNDLSGISELFKSGAYVKVILNMIKCYAYVQNADTNSYIESFKTYQKPWDINENVAPIHLDTECNIIHNAMFDSNIVIERTSEKFITFINSGTVILNVGVKASNYGNLYDTKIGICINDEQVQEIEYGTVKNDNVTPVPYKKIPLEVSKGDKCTLKLSGRSNQTGSYSTHADVYVTLYANIDTPYKYHNLIEGNGYISTEDILNALTGGNE